VPEARRHGRRALLAAVSAAALVLVSPSPASAVVGLGFTDFNGPPPPALCINPDPIDLVQASGPAAPSYTVPALAGALVITSWSHHAASASAPIEFKVYRRVSGSTYTVVGHDGPRPLTSGTVNTFSGLHLPVAPGDVIGLHTSGAPTACHFNAPGESYLYRPGDLPDRQAGDFLLNDGEYLNVSALVDLDNRIGVTGVRRSKNKGTARITVHIPNPGVLHLSGATGGFQGPRNRQVATGIVKLVVVAVGRAREKLLDRGKVRVNPVITYVPTGGPANVQMLSIKLRKR
jgi:hypothetical protein